MPDHFDIIRGDTPTIRVGPVRRPDAAGVLQPVNLAGASGKLTAKQALADADPGVFQKTGTLTTIVTTNDGMKFTLAAGDTSGLEPGDELLWDAQIVESDGTKTTFPDHGPGTMRIVGDVTLA
jgi:hypothetical protein